MWPRVVNYLGLVRMSVKRHYFDYSPPQDTDFWVVSPGGVATTMLIEHLARYGSTNRPDDSDGLKHRPRPPLRSIPTCKVVVVTGEASEVVASLERRQYDFAQAAKLGVLPHRLLFGKCRRAGLIRAIQDQSSAWSNAEGEVLVLSYADIWAQVDTLSAFLEIDSTEFSVNFPVRRSRGSAASRAIDAPAED